MAMGPEQQGNRLRFTWHTQSDVQSSTILAQTKDVINCQIFALNFLVFITFIRFIVILLSWLVIVEFIKPVCFIRRTVTQTYCFQDFVQTQRFMIGKAAFLWLMLA